MGKRVSRYATATTIAAACGLVEPAASQTIYESSDGESSVLLQDTGILAINFSDANAKIGFARKISTSPWRAGGEAKITFTDGFGTLVDEGGGIAEGGVTAYVGHLWSPQPKGRGLDFASHLLALKAGVSRSEFDIIEPEENAITEERLTSSSIALHYNALGTGLPVSSDFILGVSATYERGDNSSDLRNVELCEQLGTGTSMRGNPTMIQECQSGLLGELSQRWALKAALDFLWYQRWAENRVALAFLVRYDELADDGRWVPGFGVFVAEKGAPLRLTGGITAEFAEKGLRVGVQLGFPF